MNRQTNKISKGDTHLNRHSDLVLILEEGKSADLRRATVTPEKGRQLGRKSAAFPSGISNAPEE